MHRAAHQQPVAWEGAHVGIVASFGWSGEFNGLSLVWLHKLGVCQNVRLSGIWDVMFRHSLRIGEHGIGKRADGVELAGFEQKEIVRLRRDAACIVEGELHLLSRFHRKLGLVITERILWMGLEFDHGRVGVLSEGGQSECSDEAEQEAGLFHGWWFSCLGGATIGAR